MAQKRTDIDEMMQPQADSTGWYKCCHCEHLHVRLLDADGCLIATAVLDRPMLVRMLQTIDSEPVDEEHFH